MKSSLGPPIKSPQLLWSHYFEVYGKCSKIQNTFLFLFSDKMLVIMAATRKMPVKIANSEDPNQTASSEAVRS